MTATPHNSKEEDFQLFLALLDGDRFEGRFRDGVHVADVSDPMRRMVKERLLKFDGKPLFPEGGAVVGALARPRTSRGAGDPGCPGRGPRASACEPYRELVVAALGRGRNAMAIWQDLVDDHGFPAAYASVRRFVATLRQQARRRGPGGHHHGPR